MHFTKVQISELMRKHAEKNGLHDLMEIMLESMMLVERSEFLYENPQNKENGIVLVIPMVKVENWSSVFHVTAMVTFIPRYLPFFPIKKRNVTVWLVYYSPGHRFRDALPISNAICLRRSVTVTREFWQQICVIYSVPDNAIIPLRWPRRNGRICVRDGVKITERSSLCVTTPPTRLI